MLCVVDDVPRRRPQLRPPAETAPTRSCRPEAQASDHAGCGHRWYYCWTSTGTRRQTRGRSALRSCRRRHRRCLRFCSLSPCRRRRGCNVDNQRRCRGRAASVEDVVQTDACAATNFQLHRVEHMSHVTCTHKRHIS